MGTSPTGPLRMTIDTNLRALPMPDRAFIPGVGMPLVEGQCIIEVKYRRELPALIKGDLPLFWFEIALVPDYHQRYFICTL